MHEASITESIIETVLDTIAEKCGPCRVTKVHVTVGVCQGIVPESMQMFFDMQKPDTPLDTTELIITTQPVEAYCHACEQHRKLDIPIMYCTECGSPMTLTKGNEIVVTAIEVDEQ